MQEKEPAEIICEMIRKGELSCTINPDGTFTKAAEERISRKIDASENVFSSNIKTLKDMRTFSAEDLNSYIGPTKANSYDR